LRKTLPADLFRRLQRIDRWYGIVAGLVIASGLARLFLGIKGAAFYTHNPVFWTKMSLFVVVALLSIPPTIAYVRWSARRSADGSIVLGDAELTRLRRFLWLQVGVFALIPLCAAFMARGL
jgi:putative membrane protein